MKIIPHLSSKSGPRKEEDFIRFKEHPELPYHPNQLRAMADYKVGLGVLMMGTDFVNLSTPKYNFAFMWEKVADEGINIDGLAKLQHSTGINSGVMLFLGWDDKADGWRVAGHEGRHRVVTTIAHRTENDDYNPYVLVWLRFDFRLTNDGELNINPFYPLDPPKPIEFPMKILPNKEPTYGVGNDDDALYLEKRDIKYKLLWD